MSRITANIVCIDYPGAEDGWHKCWSTLGTDVAVVSLHEFVESKGIKKVLPRSDLVVVHKSVFPEGVFRSQLKVVTDQVRCLGQSLCVLVVSSPGIVPAETAEDGRVHLSSTPFPNEVSLAHLRDPLQALVLDLRRIGDAAAREGASAAEARRNAWKEFDKQSVAVDAEILPALSILCQGYLAVHVDPATMTAEWAGNEESPVCQMALEKMGWTELLSDDAVRKNEVLSPLLFDKTERHKLHEKVSAQGWWQVFGEGTHLEARLKEEWADVAEEGGEVLRLVRTITAPDLPQVDCKSVAEAYLAIARKLSASYGT